MYDHIKGGHCPTESIKCPQGRKSRLLSESIFIEAMFLEAVHGHGHLLSSLCVDGDMCVVS